MFTLHLQATPIISQRDVHAGGQDVWKYMHITAPSHPAANEHRAPMLTNVNVE